MLVKCYTQKKQKRKNDRKKKAEKKNQNKFNLVCIDIFVKTFSWCVTDKTQFSGGQLIFKKKTFYILMLLLLLFHFGHSLSNNNIQNKIKMKRKRDKKKNILNYLWNSLYVNTWVNQHLLLVASHHIIQIRHDINLCAYHYTLYKQPENRRWRIRIRINRNKSNIVHMMSREFF